jgi:hypothetical protein
VPLLARPKGRGSTTLGSAAEEFFNALDHIAFGVRQGQFDFRAIEMNLRQRFIRAAFAFNAYLENEVEAEALPDGRRRATTRTWEHYLWLVTRLDVLPSDKVDRQAIVLPPDHIIGPMDASPGKQVPDPGGTATPLEN